MRRFLRALWHAIVWFLEPPLVRAVRAANKHGQLILQQTQQAKGYGWTCALRAHEGEGRPRYSWTAEGETLEEAIKGCVDQALGYPIGESKILEHAPKLGSKRYDDE